MKLNKDYSVWLILLTLIGATLRTEADLTHRYSFTTDASDSIGAANGTVNGGVTILNGTAVFDGNAGSFIDLPAGLISNYTSVTFDFWIDVGVNGNWCELYALGNRDAGGNGARMLMFTPHSGAGDYRMSFADADPGFNHEFVVTQPGVLDNLGPIHITCVYNPTNHFMGLYTNGILAASRADLGTFFSLTNISNVHSWLGQSLYAPDAPYTGAIDEFRIHNAALNPLQIAGSQVSGPGTVGSDPGAVSSLSVTIKNPLPRGSSAAAVATANFAGIQGVKLAGVSGLTFSSGDTNIFRVTPDGTVTAAAAGSALLTVGFQGKTATQTINVNSGQPTTMTHRYSFTSDANDSLGGANGTLQGAAAISGGQVTLDGQDSYVELPPNLLTNYDAVSLEAWVTDNGSANWSRIWDFGNSNGGPGSQGGGTTFLFLSLPAGPGNLRGSYVATGLGEDVLEWVGGRPPAGSPAHIVWTSDISFHTGKLYVNGALVGINTNMTISPRDIGPTENDWLGRSQFNDPSFNGTIDEFRIYNGALTPLQVALDAAAGPNAILSSTGALSSVQLSIGTNSIIFGGVPVAAVLSANYANITNVNVTTLDGAQFSSGDTSVATISSNGTIIATGIGATSLSGVFGGKTNKLAITVVPPIGYTPATLVHRYSFSDPVGSKTVKDSVGSADGQIVGLGAVFDGQGQLTLPGGTSSAADPATIAGYVDLPNGIISVLTDLSIEAWVTYAGSGSWQRIFDFGTSAGGEDISNGNGNYLFMTPAGPNFLEFSVRDPVTGVEPDPLFSSTALATGQQVYLTVVYDHTANIASLYSNAVQVASGTATIDIKTISDVNNWLGRSQWGDPMFQGKYNEFRIWNGPLLPNEIVAHFSAGPDSLQSSPSPTLHAAVSGKNIVLTWPGSASGFVLQSAAKLGSGTTWSAITTTPTLTNGVDSVTLPIGSGTQFFRLSQ